MEPGEVSGPPVKDVRPVGVHHLGLVCDMIEAQDMTELVLNDHPKARGALGFGQDALRILAIENHAAAHIGEMPIRVRARNPTPWPP